MHCLGLSRDFSAYIDSDEDSDEQSRVEISSITVGECWPEFPEHT